MYPKFNYYRSKAHLKNVASLPCMVCGIEGQTQASHSNQAKHGKGRSIKASDAFTAAICVYHHSEIDQGSKMTKAEREQMWQAAHEKTVTKMLELGLWPEGVPNPLEFNSM